MKSRTSSFNKIVFKKDITRFAPVWGTYLIILLLAVISLSQERHAFYRVQYVQGLINVMPWVNLIYAAVVAQMVFGDLYNSRMCNALHALPLKRETWFGTHIASGLVFSLLPNLAATLIALPVLHLEAGWTAALWWLLASELQYLFFFGTAVLCVMLAGNRLGQLAMYAVINFAGLLSFWLADQVYQPFLHGVQFREEPFMLVSPLAQMASVNTDVLVIEHEEIVDALGHLDTYIIHAVTPGNGWGYMAICALVGVVAMLVALVLYRRRKLECSGELVAFPVLEPVATVVASVFVGSVFHLFADAFGMHFRSVILGAGMVIGFFACRMLLERTTRVFRKKAFLFCGSIVAVFGLTVLLTYLDPAGITRYIPDAAEVESITVSNSYSYHYHSNTPYVATSQEDISVLQKVHAAGIDRSSEQWDDTAQESYSAYNLRLEYKLKNGRTVDRFYYVHPRSEAGTAMKDYFTTVECVLGVKPEQVQTLASQLISIYAQGREGKEYDLEGLDIGGMFDAIIADCEAGNMAQINGYHYPNNIDLLGDREFDDIIACLELGFDREMLRHPEAQNVYYGDAYLRYLSIRVYRSCENTLKWMADNGMLTEEAQEEMVIKYGGPVATFTTGLS